MIRCICTSEKDDGDIIEILSGSSMMYWADKKINADFILQCKHSAVIYENIMLIVPTCPMAEW